MDLITFVDREVSTFSNSISTCLGKIALMTLPAIRASLFLFVMVVPGMIENHQGVHFSGQVLGY